MHPSFFRKFLVELLRSGGLRASEFAYITAKILDRVIQELHGVHRIMSEDTRILDRILIVVRSLQETRSPGIVTNRTLIALIGFTILIGIHKEVWIGILIIDNRRTILLSIRLNGGIQISAESIDFLCNAFCCITV